MKRIAVLVLGLGLLAGCGGGSKAPSVYTKAALNSCLAPRRLQISQKVDFVASTATQGAERVNVVTNDVTVLFGQDSSEANNLAEAYRRFHAKNVGIEDILRVDNNVVMLWRLHPTDGEIGVISSCLR